MLSVERIGITPVFIPVVRLDIEYVFSILLAHGDMTDVFSPF
jgi:hypothetical protein